MAVPAAVLAAVAALAVLMWLLRPPQHTYLVDWYSFRPPDRCAGSAPSSGEGFTPCCSWSLKYVDDDNDADDDVCVSPDAQFV